MVATAGRRGLRSVRRRHGPAADSSGGAARCVAFRIHDNGRGIDPAITGDFLPAAIGRRRCRGVRHGLAIVKKIVDYYGGSAYVDLGCTAGTAFVVALPPAPVDAGNRLPPQGPSWRRLVTGRTLPSPQEICPAIVAIATRVRTVEKTTVAQGTVPFSLRENRTVPACSFAGPNWDCKCCAGWSFSPGLVAWSAEEKEPMSVMLQLPIISTRRREQEGRKRKPHRKIFRPLQTSANTVPPSAVIISPCPWTRPRTGTTSTPSAGS